MSIADKLKDLPDTPGVYIMRDASGQVIYVGKKLATRCKAQIEIVIETGTGKFFELACARPQAVHRLQYRNNVAHGHADKRSEIPRAVAL